MGISGAAWNYRIECVCNGSLSSSVFSKSIKNFAVLRAFVNLIDQSGTLHEAEQIAQIGPLYENEVARIMSDAFLQDVPRIAASEGFQAINEEFLMDRGTSAKDTFGEILLMRPIYKTHIASKMA